MKLCVLRDPKLSRNEFNEVNEAIVRVTSGSGQRVALNDDVIRGWSKILGFNQGGRYVVVESALLRAKLDAENPSRIVMLADPGKEYGVEVNLHTLQLTLKSNHLQVIGNDKKWSYRNGAVLGFYSSIFCVLIPKFFVILRLYPETLLVLKTSKLFSKLR